MNLYSQPYSNNSNHKIVPSIYIVSWNKKHSLRCFFPSGILRTIEWKMTLLSEINCSVPYWETVVFHFMSQCPALPQKNRCWEVAYVWLKTPSSAVSLPIITALINESFPLEDKCWGLITPLWVLEVLETFQWCLLLKMRAFWKGIARSVAL